MIILVDVDNTIASWDDAFLLRFSHDVSDRVRNRACFRIEDVPWTPQEREEVDAILREGSLYRDLPLYEGAKAALSEMLFEGHDVFLVTSPHAGCTGPCAMHKIEWVREQLGDAWVARTILTADKTLVHGDVLVDDKPSVSGARTPSFRHVRYRQHYNRGVAGTRLERWGEWRRVLLLC